MNVWRHLRFVGSLLLLGLCTLTLEAGDDDAAVIKALKDRGANVVVNGKGAVVEIGLHKKSLGDADLVLLKRFKTLKTLTLQASSVTDDGLKHLSELEKLESLDVLHTRVTPKGLAHIKDIKSLQRLGYGSGQVTDDALRQLLKMGLAHKLIGVSGQRAPARSPADVTHIQMHIWDLSDAGVKQLAAFPSLTTLSIVPAQMTDGMMSSLREINLLHALEYANTPNSDRRPKSAADVSFMQLKGQHVTAAGVKQLAVFTALKHIDIAQSNLGDTAMKEIAALKTLESIYLSKRVTDAGLKELTALPNLKVITIDQGSPITNAGMMHLGQIKTLESLSLSETRVTPDALKELKGLKLHTLYLANRQINDTTLQELRKIDLLHALNNAFGKGRPKSLDKVEFLRLGGTGVTDVGLRELTGLTSAIRIELYNTKVTDAGVAELKKSLPNVKIAR